MAKGLEIRENLILEEIFDFTILVWIFQTQTQNLFFLNLSNILIMGSFSE
jgi:hypothetical protein